MRLRPVVAVDDRRLRSFLVVEHEIDREPRLLRPARVRRLAAIADHVPCIVAGHLASNREKGLQDQFGLRSRNFTTLPHFSVSASRCFANSAGETVMVVAPRLSNLALILGLSRTALISRL